MVLLNGRSLYVDELERLGLGTERVLKQTRSLVRNHKMISTSKRRIMENVGFDQTGFSVSGGTDPWEFLGDESGREGFGDPGERI